jgi:hypothetical protein
MPSGCAKGYATDRGRAGLVFQVRSEVTVRGNRERVNTQELCKCEILFRRSARRNANQAKVEFDPPEARTQGVLGTRAMRAASRRETRKATFAQRVHRFGTDQFSVPGSQFSV